MGPLLGNSLGGYIEAFSGLPLYFYLFHIYKPCLTLILDNTSQLIVDIPPGSKLRYPELVGSPSWATLAVPPWWFCPNFTPPPSGVCLTSPSWATLDANIYGAWPTLPWQCGCSWNCHETKCDKIIEIKLEGLVGLGIVSVCILSSLYVILFSNGLLNPSSWDLINVPDDDSFLLPNFDSYEQRKKSQTSVNISLHEEDRQFERSALGPSSIIFCNDKPGCLPSLDCWLICNILEAGFLWSPFHDR